MPNYTPNYRLIKPTDSEYFDISNDNNNMDIIDNNLNLQNIEIKKINTETIPNSKKYSVENTNNLKGICVRSWITGSLNTGRFRKDLISNCNDLGINSISLTINTYQNKFVDNNPFNRVPIDNTELENYLIFLRENNLRILFKHHVELDDEASGAWRANIDPSDSDLWFSNYSNGIIEYAKLCEKYGIEIMSIGSEYKTLTTKYPKKWEELIKEIRKNYSGLLTYGANLNNDLSDEANSISFWNELDIIGIDFYVYPFASGSLEKQIYGFNHDTNHRNIMVILESLTQLYNKPLIFCEYGKSGDDENTNNLIQATIKTFFDKKYFIGGFIWVHDPTLNDWYETENKKNILRNFKNKHNVKSELKYYRTSENVGWQKFLEYNIQSPYSDFDISFEFAMKKQSWNKNQMDGIVDIRVATQELNDKRITMKISGNLSNNNFGYTIVDNTISFYVNVSSGSVYLFKVIKSLDIEMCNILSYQTAVSNIDGLIKSKQLSGSLNTVANIQNTAIGNDIIITTGQFTGNLSSGSLSNNITLPDIGATILSINININSLTGGDIKDIVCNGTISGNILNIKGQHISIQGSYSYSGNFLIISKQS